MASPSITARLGGSSPEPAALAATSLEKRYGDVHALRGIDIEIAPGELFGLLGPNGAGKSTLVKLACGLMRPSSGQVAIAGARAGTAAAQRAIGYLAELFRFPEWCTAEELLVLHQKLVGSAGGQAERDRLLARVGLADAARKRVGAMSKGMQQRLGLAQALIGAPRLLLLDEPTSALDPAGRRMVRALMEELRADGVAVLLNSHLLSEVEQVCDRVAIIARGQVVAQGSPAELGGPAGVHVETGAGRREFPAATRSDVPQLVRSLVQAGEDVFSVELKRSTLEDAYLAAIASSDADAVAAAAAGASGVPPALAATETAA